MSVRWRLTLIATVVFGVAFVAAAWGLVTVVHGNLVDGIKETNEKELALLANVFGVLSAHAAGLYLTFLYLALIQAVIVFVQLVNSLFAGVDDESQ